MHIEFPSRNLFFLIDVRTIRLNYRDFWKGSLCRSGWRNKIISRIVLMPLACAGQKSNQLNHVKEQSITS